MRNHAADGMKTGWRHWCTSVNMVKAMNLMRQGGFAGISANGRQL